MSPFYSLLFLAITYYHFFPFPIWLSSCPYSSQLAHRSLSNITITWVPISSTELLLLSYYSQLPQVLQYYWRRLAPLLPVLPILTPTHTKHSLNLSLFRQNVLYSFLQVSPAFTMEVFIPLFLRISISSYLERKKKSELYIYDKMYSLQYVNIGRCIA